MPVLDLKVPPLVVAVFMAMLMWLASSALPAFGFGFPAQRLCAVILAVAGAVTVALGIASFKRARTTINPRKPGAASSLVVSGLYAFTRNPIYLGLLLVIAGWAVFLSNVLAFFFLPAFVFYMNRFQIEPEERSLTARFGEEFVAYKSRARRWL